MDTRTVARAFQRVPSNTLAACPGPFAASSNWLLALVLGMICFGCSVGCFRRAAARAAAASAFCLLIAACWALAAPAASAFLLLMAACWALKACAASAFFLFMAAC